MKKKLALSVAAAALVGTLAVGGTLAYLTDYETATNTITTGNVDVMIKETNPGAKDEDDGYTSIAVPGSGVTYSSVEPGVKIAKDPLLIYKGDSKAYIRYKINVNVAGEDLTEDEEKAFQHAIKFYSKNTDAEGKEVLASVDYKLDNYYYAGFNMTEQLKQDFVAADCKKTMPNDSVFVKDEEGNHQFGTLFDVVKLDNSVEINNVKYTFDNDLLAKLQDIQIVITAEAIQADGLDSDDDNTTTELNEVVAAFGSGPIKNFESNNNVTVDTKKTE